MTHQVKRNRVIILSKYQVGYESYVACMVYTLVHSREITQDRKQGGITILACDTLSGPDIYTYQILSKYLKGVEAMECTRFSQ